MKPVRVLMAAMMSVALLTGLTACGGGDSPPAPVPAKLAVALTASGQIVTFDVTTPGTFSTNVSITGVGAGETILGLDVRPANGMIYGITATKIYSINRSTGVATQVSVLAADPSDATAPFTGISGTQFGVDFNPVPDRLRVVSDAGQNLRINVDSGLVTTDGTLNGAATAANAAAYANSFSGATTTTLYILASASDTLYIQNPPNNGTLGTALAVTLNGSPLDFSATNSFDMDGATGIAYAGLTVAGTSSLYTINLATGAATQLGTAGAGTSALVGFSILP